ncbi:hypothetical protein HELRODRAFT_99395 [Helobdella robusta]|uniref:Histidine ammonia-lyase n=1 Tax=Helobdella robusta TaxID=6412 RepID=T1G9S6_HELRO|nr:hypothetical protein HELRODRAFT_99395 [Helobdella robusta]ESO05074.1 hypothetical protein HELRODRAFT_99395 [Helobdella robusta]
MDGDSLKCEELMELGFGKVAIQVSKEALVKVQNARSFVEDEILAKNRVTYGINTGFGRFASTVVCKDDLSLLQYNLITSTAAGVGSPLSLERTRRMMALRINVLTKGFSGISVRVLRQFIDAFNASCLSWVPEKGTVGASGDLAPLAHLAIGMMGQGKMWSPGTDYGDADKILKFHGLSPIKLAAKEGLALINGTQLITALGVEALIRAENICKQADVVASLSLEALKGTTRAFDPDVHRVRPHPGQSMVAARMRSLLHSDRYPSEVSESHKYCDKVQDAYTLRCIPQVHGVVNDTIKFVRGILETEINSATDNPLILAERGDVISGGNFHGEYPAKSLDYLAIAIHEIANMSERRIERLNNPNYSGLPAFLTNNGGLNSGFMIAHCTAAALVSENKTLCHPASVDSLSTSAGTEDHVSMGGWAARKALRVVENVEDVVGVELLCACQGLEFHRPLKTTEPLETLHELVRKRVKPWDKDRFLAPDMNNASALLRSLKVWQTVRAYIENDEDEDDNGDREMENNKKRLVNGS